MIYFFSIIAIVVFYLVTGGFWGGVFQAEGEEFSLFVFVWPLMLAHAIGKKITTRKTKQDDLAI